MKQEDVQSLVDQLFSMDVTPTTNASQHRVYYNDFGQILLLSPRESEDMKDEMFIRVSKERYIALSEGSLKAWMVDTSQSPPQLINISKDAMSSSNRVHLIREYNPKRLFNFEFNMDTRKLTLESKGSLPDKKTIWVTPKGQYSKMLKRIDFQATGKHEFDIPEYINTKQISLISRNNLEMLVSYRTVND